MSQLDDLTALQAETAASQAATAASIAEIAVDLDALVALVSAQPPPVDLTEAIAAATAIRDSAKSLADASAADAAKFTPSA